MRDFSKVAPSIWRSRKFWLLPDDSARFVYLYLLTNPHANSAGCYSLPALYACADLQWSHEAYLKAIDSLTVVDLIEFDDAENTVRVVNWMTFNEPTNPKHALGILIQLSQAPSLTLKLNAFKDFKVVVEARRFTDDKALRKAMDIFRETIERVSPPRSRPEIEMEKEIETRPDLEKDLDARARAAPDRAGAVGAALPPLDIPSRFDTPLLQRTARR